MPLSLFNTSLPHNFICWMNGIVSICLPLMKPRLRPWISPELPLGMCRYGSDCSNAYRRVCGCSAVDVLRWQFRCVIAPIPDTYYLNFQYILYIIKSITLFVRLMHYSRVTVQQCIRQHESWSILLFSFHDTVSKHLLSDRFSHSHERVFKL